MKAIWIYPQDLGLDQWGYQWATFCEKFGYPYDNPPAGILLAEIKTNQ